MNITICEPHSDDAWLNLGGYMLLHPDYQFKIITVAVSPKNYNKTFALKNFGKIENICYGFKTLEKEDFVIKQHPFFADGA